MNGLHLLSSYYTSEADSFDGPIVHVFLIRFHAAYYSVIDFYSHVVGLYVVTFYLRLVVLCVAANGLYARYAVHYGLARLEIGFN